VKSVFTLSISLLFFIGSGWAFADIPEIKPGVKVKDGSLDLQVNGHSSPTMVDWDNDGAKDLLVGQRINGQIHLFLNQGTDLNPLFQGSTLIESGGSPIQVPPG